MACTDPGYINICTQGTSFAFYEAASRPSMALLRHSGCSVVRYFILESAIFTTLTAVFLVCGAIRFVFAWMVILGFRTGLIKFALITAKKPTPFEG
jgi:hypothetical protein